MTRRDWFNKQTLELQEKFKHNCDTLNEGIKFFKLWIDNGATKGLDGAFAFYLSDEGHDFWHKLSVKLKEAQESGK